MELSTPVQLPSRRFLILAGFDLLFVAIGFTYAQAEATGTHLMLFIVGALVLAGGLVRDKLIGSVLS